MVTIVALLPFLVLFLLLIILEKPAYIAGPIALFFTSIIALTFWGMDFSWFGASLVKGALLTLELMIILVGVLFMTDLIKKEGVLSYIKHSIFKISRDVRVQVLLVSWLIVAFIEGIAGFGTPSMIAGPLLVALGLSPLAAVTTSLIGDAAAVTFGAAGVPMTIGIGEGISADQINILGADFVSQTYLGAAYLHLILGMFLPLVILCVLNIIYERSIRKALAAWKLAFAAGLAYLIPSVLIATYLGPEFPSILGSLIGLIFVVLLIKNKWLLPRKEWVFEKQDERIAREMKHAKEKGMFFKSVLPYGLVIAMLLLTRMDVFGIGGFLKSATISFDGILGTDMSHSLSILYSPGFFFFVASIIAFAFYKLKSRDIADIVRSAGGKSIKICIALFSILGVVQILLYSGHNAFGYESFLGHIVSLMTQAGSAWPILSPFVGFFGAFLAGSSTVSNLMFASLQVDAAIAVGMIPILGLIMQSMGSAAGNMIAVHNVIAASAVVRMEHAEGKVIKYNIIPAFGYALAAGILIMFVIWIMK